MWHLTLVTQFNIQITILTLNPSLKLCCRRALPFDADWATLPGGRPTPGHASTRALVSEWAGQWPGRAGGLCQGPGHQWSQCAAGGAGKVGGNTGEKKHFQVIIDFSRNQDPGSVRPGCQRQGDQCTVGGQGDPCHNGGQCTAGWNRFICDCTQTNFTGPSCTRGEKKTIEKYLEEALTSSYTFCAPTFVCRLILIKADNNIIPNCHRHCMQGTTAVILHTEYSLRQHNTLSIIQYCSSKMSSFCLCGWMFDLHSRFC